MPKSNNAMQMTYGMIHANSNEISVFKFLETEISKRFQLKKSLNPESELGAIALHLGSAFGNQFGFEPSFESFFDSFM